MSAYVKKASIGGRWVWESEGASSLHNQNNAATVSGSPPPALSDLISAIGAIQCALSLLNAYARRTDDPPAGVVEVADLLDLALMFLSGHDTGE